MRGIVNPADSVEVQNAKLLKIAGALMERVERTTDESGDSFAHFQTAIALEEQVRERTRDLQAALDHLNRANVELSATKAEAEAARTHLANAIEAIQEGFALFDRDATMVMRNSRFCIFLPDVSHQMAPPITYDQYAGTVARSRYLAFPDPRARAAFHERRMAAHQRRHVNFTVELTGDRWVQVSEQHTPDGGTAILQTEITDIVRLERQQRDRLLDTQAVMIRATLEHLQQGVAIFDAEARLVGSNSRLASFLTPPVQLLRAGTSFSSMAEYFDARGLFVERSQVERIAGWVVRDEREPLALRVSTVEDQVFDLFCQRMPDGGFVLSLTDITAERRAADALQRLNETLEVRVLERTEELRTARDDAERANETRTRFVAAVSHDLLQPLNAAKLFLAGIDLAAVPENEAGKLDRAKNALGSVETILGALLDITRLDTAEPGIDRGDMPLAPVMRALAVEYRGLAEAKGVALEVEPLEVMINSDRTYFRRILQNLIGNAIRYTSAGSVRVGAKLAGETVILTVADTGCGIPAARRDEVFRAFTRLPQTASTEPGVGLGLAIVERACRLLDHQLSMESEVDRGTTFTLTVPLARRSGVSPRATAETAPETLRLEGLAAVVIENDVETSAALAQLLEGWKMHIVEAVSGAEALGLLDEIALMPDVILSDCHLGPAPDGLDAIAELRRRFGDIPAVLLTADRSPEVAERAARAAVPVVHKPVEPAELRARLCAQIERSNHAAGLAH